MVYPIVDDLLLIWICFPPFLCAVGPVIMSIEEKMEADGRSIYVGNVSLMLKS